MRADAWPKLTVIPYFIVRGEITASPAEFLSTLLAKLGQRYDRPCVTVGNAEELAGELQRELQVISRILQQRGEKLLVLIDGLDESVNAEGEAAAGMSLLRYIPRDVPPGIFVVLAGRRRREVDVLGSELRKLHEMELPGLTGPEVQNLLELRISEFDVESAYARQVTQLSQGNPLYVKLLLESLLEGQMQLNDTPALPKHIRDFFERTLTRLLARDAEARVRVLLALALAREQFTVEQVAGIVGRSVPEAYGTLEAFAEVISEHRNLEGRAVYRVFHDSFGDYLRSHKVHASLVPDLSRRILSFAASRVPDRSAEPELLQAVERLFDGSVLCPADAPALALLIERTSRLLTGHSLMLQNLARRPFEELGPLLLALGRCLGPAAARTTIESAVTLAEEQPSGVGRMAHGVGPTARARAESGDRPGQHAGRPHRPGSRRTNLPRALDAGGRPPGSSGGLRRPRP